MRNLVDKKVFQTHLYASIFDDRPERDYKHNFCYAFNLPHTVGSTTSYMKLVQKKMAEEREPTISFINYYVILSTFSAYRI
jgi:hypothetical protein